MRKNNKRAGQGLALFCMCHGVARKFLATQEGCVTKKVVFIYNNIMDDFAYNDYQIFSPQVMEQLARAYYGGLKQRQGGEIDKEKSSLLWLYEELEKRTFQRRKIMALRKIIVELKKEQTECEATKKVCCTNYSQNVLIRKIIRLELACVSRTLAHPEECENHIGNINKLLDMF